MMNNDMTVQDIANKVYEKYGKDEGDMKGLAYSIVRWSFNIEFCDALEALNIARKTIDKKNH